MFTIALLSLIALLLAAVGYEVKLRASARQASGDDLVAQFSQLEAAFAADERQAARDRRKERELERQHERELQGLPPLARKPRKTAPLPPSLTGKSSASELPASETPVAANEVPNPQSPSANRPPDLSPHPPRNQRSAAKPAERKSPQVAIQPNPIRPALAYPATPFRTSKFFQTLSHCLAAASYVTAALRRLAILPRALSSFFTRKIPPAVPASAPSERDPAPANHH